MYELGIDIIFSPSARFADILYPRTVTRAKVYHSISGLVDEGDIVLANKYYNPHISRNFF